MPRGKRKPDPMAGYTGAKPKASKGPTLRAEERSYAVDEADLTAWLTGDDARQFFIKEVWIQPSGSIEFTVSTVKPTERPVARRERIPADARVGLAQIAAERAQEGAGPRIVEDADGVTDQDVSSGPTGKADADPFIAKRGESTAKTRLKSRRELNLEARAKGQPERPMPNITERTEDEDDPVPSAIPR
jgi:hypothetical protein